MRPPYSVSCRLFSLCALLTVTPAAAEAAETVNIYSAQQEHLIRPVLDAFEEKTGIDVKLSTGKAPALAARLESEGERTPADIFMTADIGNIYQAKERGLLQPVSSDILRERLPAYLQDDSGFWYGFTVRARAVFYNKDVTDGETLKRYSDIAGEEWRDALLIRSSSNMYNQSLLAWLIQGAGEEAAKQWAQGVVANMAREPQGGDTDQLRALAAGEGKIAVANTYYYGRLVAGDDDMRDERVIEKVGVIFPEGPDGGTHINIRGGGVTAHAKNKENAVKLLEYFVSDEAQRMFADLNFEYPAVASVPVPEALKDLGTFRYSETPLEEIGARNADAVRIADGAGWK